MQVVHKFILSHAASKRDNRFHHKKSNCRKTTASVYLCN